MPAVVAIVAGGLILAASVALADADAIETLRRECAAQLNLPPGGCDCIAGKAGELNDNQQAFLAATFSKNQGVAATLRGQMTVDELTQAAMFATNAPQTCAQGG
jgi:hypothetical protein